MWDEHFDKDRQTDMPAIWCALLAPEFYYPSGNNRPLRRMGSRKRRSSSTRRIMIVTATKTATKVQSCLERTEPSNRGPRKPEEENEEQEEQEIANSSSVLHINYS